MVLYAMPEFVLGMIFILIFASALHIFPVNRYESAIPMTGFSHWIDVANHMALPWLTLTLAYVGEFYLVMRSSLLDTLGEEYIALARAKGVREKYVLAQARGAERAAADHHARRPVVRVHPERRHHDRVRLQLSRASASCRSTPSPPRDFAVLQATFVISVIAVLLANFVADLTYAYLDPRVRRA